MDLGSDDFMSSVDKKLGAGDSRRLRLRSHIDRNLPSVAAFLIDRSQRTKAFPIDQLHRRLNLLQNFIAISYTYPTLATKGEDSLI
jgi:hypothetical protein